MMFWVSTQFILFVDSIYMNAGREQKSIFVLCIFYILGFITQTYTFWINEDLSHVTAQFSSIKYN